MRHFIGNEIRNEMKRNLAVDVQSSGNSAFGTSRMYRVSRGRVVKSGGED